MKKLNLLVLPICLGIFILLFSWFRSYPVSIESPYDFAYNHFSYLYWIGLAILFASFFILAIKTENRSLRLAITVVTVFLMFSPAYFYFTLPTSDANQLRGLTEYFVSTGNLGGSNLYRSYYQWPIFFMLNKMLISITGLSQRFCEFLLYGIIGSVTTSLIYLILSKARRNAYLAVTTFFIILFYFFNFQFWAPFTLAFCFVLLLFYLDNLKEKPEITIAILIIFIIMAFTHALVPLFFIVYSLVMYFLKKDRRHLNLFAITFVIFIFLQSINQYLSYYVNQLVDFSFFDYFIGKVEVTTSSSLTSQPFVDVVAQFFSRTVVIATMFAAVLGFIVLLKKRKLEKTDYAMLITGAIFITTLVVAPSNYSMMSNRSYFLLCIPASMGAAYLCESKLRKYFKTLFLILLILFTFVLVHQSFYNQEIFFQTKAEYRSVSFVVNEVNWSNPTSMLSNYRLQLYLNSISLDGNITFYAVSSTTVLTDYDLIVYNVGLAKALVTANYSEAQVFKEFNMNHFNLIFNSGNYSIVFSKGLSK